MTKIVKIDLIEDNQIVCYFENNEVRILNLQSSISDRYINKILSDKKIFKSAKIGELGEIYWSDIAEIRDLDGKTKLCQYDISPEFAYFNSKLVTEAIDTV